MLSAIDSDGLVNSKCMQSKEITEAYLSENNYQSLYIRLTGVYQSSFFTQYILLMVFFFGYK